MISDAPDLEVARLGDDSDDLHAAASRVDSRSRRTIWKMLFQMPKGDEHWARALSDQEDSGRSVAHPEFVELAAPA